MQKIAPYLLDKAFYDKADTLLSFTDNAHDYFLKGNLFQRRKIMEIISEQITYKDKNFDIKLKPIFQTIIENQYNLVQKMLTIELLKQALKKGLKLILALIIEKTPQVGLEPTTYRLTAGCSAIELLRIISVYLIVCELHSRFSSPRLV